MNKSGYRIVLEDCMGVKEDETVLILTDDGKINIGEGLYEEAKNLAKEAVLMVMKPRTVSGEEPPKAIAEAMKNFDVIVCPTSHSITHTNAKINAVKTGARLASMPGITEDMFKEGAITADYSKVEALSLKIAEVLNNGKKAKIVKDNHVLEMDISGRKAKASTGILKKSGSTGNLPSGEAYLAPIEDSTNGEMIIDGSIVGVGKLKTPLYVKIKDGKLVELTGEDSDKLEMLFDNERNSTVGELGIGTNHAARLTGVILEDEKIYGTIHIAFGTNTSFGGTNKADCHIDGVILKPSLYIDDKLIMEDGEFVI